MTPTTADQLRSALAEQIGHAVGEVVSIENLKTLAGGASRETWRFDVLAGNGAPSNSDALILRRQLGGKIYEAALDVAAEYAVLRSVFEAGAPCPRSRWFFPDLLGRPAMVVARLPGESIGRRIVRDPALADARARLPAALGDALARIHRVPVDNSALQQILPTPDPDSTPARVAIEQLESDLDRIDEPHPALELVIRWLRRNEPPAPARRALVHGDFRIGNVLVSPAGLEGVLDWEFAHVGEPAEDLAWGLVREWRFGVDELRFGGVGSADAFFAAYQSATGEPVDRQRVDYWEVMGNARWAIGALNQARRHLSGQEPNLEFASLGRRCAEMELEAIRLIRGIR